MLFDFLLVCFNLACNVQISLAICVKRLGIEMLEICFEIISVFDSEGNEKNTDYMRMLKIVKSSGYSGFIGVEYEGSELSEVEGIKATRDLLLKVGAQV